MAHMLGVAAALLRQDLNFLLPFLEVIVLMDFHPQIINRT